MKRGAKQNPYSKDKLMLAILSRGGSFTELELGEILTGKRQRGARSLIANARKEGHQIAHKFTVNVVTGRLNRSYYLENDDKKYIIWARQNGTFNFNTWTPKSPF